MLSRVAQVAGVPLLASVAKGVELARPTPSVLLASGELTGSGFTALLGVTFLVGLSLGAVAVLEILKGRRR